MNNNIKHKNELQPVYLIVGSDKLRRNVVLSRLSKRLEELGDMSFNSEKIDVATRSDTETPIGSEIVSACRTMPFASDKRYVCVQNVDKLDKDSTEALIDYVNNPVDTCVLALVADKLAKNTRLYKAIKSSSANNIIECQPPKAYELANNLNAIARSHNGSIANDAAKKLIDLIGSDTTKLDNEIKRLMLATKDNNITLQVVLSNTAHTAEAKPWTFVNYFSARNINACVQTLRNMDNNAPYILLPMICNRVKELICTQSLAAKGLPTNQNTIAKELHMAPWQCKNHASWANTFSRMQLRNILRKALTCEAEIKSGSDPNLTFEMFVVDSLS